MRAYFVGSTTAHENVGRGEGVAMFQSERCEDARGSFTLLWGGSLWEAARDANSPPLGV
jgi:hypothetical protein